jgi:hypothetical protein
MRVRRFLNSLIILVWVFAQTVTAAHSYTHPTAIDHVMSQSSAEADSHAQPLTAEVKPGCHTHLPQNASKSADGQHNGSAADDCCSDMQCQNAAVLKCALASLDLGGEDPFAKLAVRHDGHSPSFVLPPPNLLV